MEFDIFTVKYAFDADTLDKYNSVNADDMPLPIELTDGHLWTIRNKIRTLTLYFRIIVIVPSVYIACEVPGTNTLPYWLLYEAIISRTYIGVKFGLFYLIDALLVYMLSIQFEIRGVFGFILAEVGINWWEEGLCPYLRRQSHFGACTTLLSIFFLTLNLQCNSAGRWLHRRYE